MNADGLHRSKARKNCGISGLRTRMGMLIASFLVIGGSGAFAQSPANGLEGIWLNHTGRGAVELKSCGQSLCGRIVWLKQPFDKRGRRLTDKRNSETAQQKRQICGLQVIGGVKKIGRNTYDQGWIYSPERGQGYNVELHLQNRNRLRVTGYLGVKFLGQAFIWKRIPDDSPVHDGETCDTAKP